MVHVKSRIDARSAPRSAERMKLRSSRRELARRIREIAASRGDEPDIEVRRDDYLAALERLHKNVQRWLAPFVVKAVVSISIKNIEVEEDAIGAYKAPQLHISVQHGPIIRLIPQGFVVHDALGRINMASGRRTETMIMDLDRKWRFVHRSPSCLGSTRVPVTEDSFANAMLGLLRDD